MNNFCNWLENSSDILSPNVEIRLIDKSTGYGLFTKESVRMNEILIKISEKFIITAQFVANIKEYSDILTRFSFDSSELLTLFFALERIYFDYFCKQTSNDLNDETLYIVQWEMEIPNGLKRFLGSRRELIDGNQKENNLWWKSYIDILPRSFSTPLFIYYLTKNGKDKLKEIYSQLPLECRERLLEQLSELTIFEEKFFNFLNDIPNEEITKNLTEMSEHSITFWKEICCWAWHIVNTRSIFTENLPSFPLQNSEPKRPSKKKNSTEDEENSFRGSLALVPLVDLINHSPEAKCVPTFDKKLNCYKVIAEHSIGAGQQLFFCYGAHSNDQLWIDYGFRIRNNPFNRVNISIDLFIALAERCEHRYESLRKEILKKANLSCSIYATDEFPSFSLRKNCSILLMEKSKLTKWSQYLFSNDENEEDEEENLKSPEIKLIGSILKKLVNALVARKNECLFKEVCVSWEEQIEILQRMLANICQH